MQTQIELSSGQIKESIVLAYKLINTFASKKFEKSLKELWLGSKHDNVFAIQTKLCNGIAIKRSRFKRDEEEQGIKDYLDFLCGVKGIKIKQTDKKGLVRDFSIKEYEIASRFIYKVSACERFTGVNGGNQFNSILMNVSGI